MIRVFKSGRHAHRTPLSYPALEPLWERTIALVDRVQAADIYVFAHVLDIAEAPREMVEDWRRRRCPVVLLSEEPFWDTIWGKRPMDRHIYVETDYGVLPVWQINHQTSTVFDFDRIPYYLLTNHRFANAYRFRFERNARRSATDWREEHASRAADLVFMFERRPEPWHDVVWPEGDVIGLCAWRTGMAQSCKGARVERLGRSWQGEGPKRQELPDWHLDKLTRLDGHARMISAVENTHQPQYITEKLFDAYACGAFPLYYASPGHRMHGFGLPPESWINLFGMSPQEAAERAGALGPDATAFEAFAEAQRRLAALFGDTAAWIDERGRLARALPEILTEALDA